MSRVAPTDHIDSNIITYKVAPCQTVVFYLNFDWNVRDDWMVYQNYELPVFAFVDTYNVGSGNYKSAYAIRMPCDTQEGKEFNFGEYRRNFMRIVQGANNAELSSWQRRFDISLQVEESVPSIYDNFWIQALQIIVIVGLLVGTLMLIGFNNNLI